MASSSSRFVIPTDPGDAVSAIFIDESVIACGTLLGKIWVYNLSANTRSMYAGFSDDSIRGIYIQDGSIYATVGDQYCRVIRLNDPADQLEARFDRRSGSSGFRYVLQKFNQVTIVYPGMTTFADVVTNDQNMCPFKIQQANILNVIPVDSFHYYLLLSEFPASTSGDDIVRDPRRFRIADVSTGDSIYSFPGDRIPFVRLIDKRHVFVVEKINKRFVVFDFKDKKEVIKMKNPHKCDIVAMDAVFHLRLTRSEDLEASMSSAGRSSTSSFEHVLHKTLVTTVSLDGQIFVWDYLTGSIHFSGAIAKSTFCFSLGFPYLVQSVMLPDASGVQVAVSHDYGLSLVLLKPSSATTTPPPH